MDTTENTRVNLKCIFFVMDRVAPSWDPMDPNVLNVVDPNSDLGRYLAISLQATAEEEEEENNTGRLTDDQIKVIIERLPRLTEADLDRLGQRDSSCSICLNTFLACIAEEETAYVMDSPAQPVEDLGVTRLADTCEHVFCRKDLSAWIRDRNITCPICRTRLIKSNLDRAAVNAARQHILRAWRAERQILNGDQLRSTDFGHYG